MALYVDVHLRHRYQDDPPRSIAEIEASHARDLACEAKYGVRFVGVWYDAAAGATNCLVEAPGIDAALMTHLEAHGPSGEPVRIIEVSREEVDGFLGGMCTTASGVALSEDGTAIGSPFRTVLFTDLERSTSLTLELGDRAAMDVLRAHDRIVREAIGGGGGREVKHTGDGIMAAFLSAANAVEAAVAMQRAFALHNQRGDGIQLHVRVGLAAGEPVSDHEDLFGAAVQLARRICDHAQPGQVLVSAAIRELCAGKKLEFVDRGEATFKGFETPSRYYEVPSRVD